LPARKAEEDAIWSSCWARPTNERHGKDHQAASRTKTSKRTQNTVVKKKRHTVKNTVIATSSRFICFWEEPFGAVSITALLCSRRVQEVFGDHQTLGGLRRVLFQVQTRSYLPQEAQKD